jgi:hypothetical protein
MLWIDNHLSPTMHQVVGCAFGIVVCAWYVGATSEQVAAIRLPASLIVVFYTLTWLIGAAVRILKRGM